MSTIEALLLGVLQGLTEFLPISSSGHLALVQHLLGFQQLDRLLVFDLVCHMGTLIAILWVYWSQIRDISFRRFFQIILGTLPLFLILPILKQIESLYDQTDLLGPFFIVSGLVLYAGIRWGSEKPSTELQKHWIRDPLLIGLAQTFALIPAVSRSGMTISSAHLLGWKPKETVAFSFLLAIPAILGGTILKVGELFFQDAPITSMSNGAYLSGFLSSFVVGAAALHLLIKLATKQKLMYFVWYCLLLGIGTTIYFSLYT